MSNIVIVNSLPEKEWDNFVKNHPLGNIFHTPEMFQVFLQARGYKPDLWAATSNGRILVLFLPIQITIANGLLKFLTTRTVVFGDLLFTPTDEGYEALNKLLVSYNQNVKGHSLFTELRHQAETRDIRPILRSTGFRFEEHCNYLVNLDSSVEEVWHNIHSSARKKINKILKNEALIVEELQSEEKLPIWYDLIHESFSCKHVFLADYSLFKTAFEILYNQKKIQFFLIRLNDKYIAASVRLLYKDIIYAWYSGFNREYGSYHPNELMTWHVLKWGAENGYRIFDFGGAGKPSEDYGPRDFKAKFGGKLVYYGRSTCVHAPLKLKFSKVGYDLLRKLL
jgi:serine/alanine adding enzyme